MESAMSRPINWIMVLELVQMLEAGGVAGRQASQASRGRVGEEKV